ncbi:MAG: TetR/AcrR family transcriptional regulator [Sinimarinibacterium sp.]|jgi:AcrR family transcriptional regulator
MAQSEHIKEQVNKLKQELILGKAIDLFYERGYRGASMGTIASELGVTKPFLYYRYKSKADVLAEVFARAESLALAELLEQLASDSPPDVKLRNIVRQLVEIALDNQKLLAVFYTEERNLPPRKIAKSRKIRVEWQENLGKLLEEGKRKKIFHYGDVEITVHAILGSVLWSYHWYPEYGSKRRDHIVRELTNTALALVGFEAPK